MPTISMFFGIIIRMYNNGEHNPPHFHAYYQNNEAMFDFDGQLIKGQMPNKQASLIKAWTIIHVEELQANWELAMQKETLFKIEPLR